MLALALLPTISHALASVRGQTRLSDICTTQVAGLVAFSAAVSDVGDPGSPTSPSLHLEHCSFCGAHHGAVGMPPVLVFAPVPGPTGAHPPELFLRAPRTLHAWRSAQPRAPPITC